MSGRPRFDNNASMEKSIPFTTLPKDIYQTGVRYRPIHSVGDTVKAKCPYCASAEKPGCEKCQDGFIEVGFASGDLYTRHCNACGEDNGGRIVGEEPAMPLESIQEKPEPCVWCGSEDMVWQMVAKIVPKPKDTNGHG